MDEIRLREHVELIREVFYYSHRFHEKTFVFKIDYPVVLSPDFPQLMKDLAMLNQTGIRIILVPGAKERIDEVLSEYHIVTPHQGNQRVTPPEALPFIKMAAFDVANKLLTQLSAYRVNAVIGNLVRARGLGTIDGLDYQHSGRVEKINVEFLEDLLEGDHMPILPCIGWSAAGKPYNISSDDLAVAVSETLGAEKLFFVTTFQGVSVEGLDTRLDLEVGAEGRIARLSAPQAEQLLSANASQAERPDLRYLAQAVRACRRGVERVHIVDGEVEGVVLKEIFSNLGIGTMVYTNDYESIRPMRSGDIPDVLRLMRPLVDQGILINRTEEDLLNSYRDFVVYEVDGALHACGALHVYEDGQAEIAGIATNQAFSHLSMGKRIMLYLIDKAVKQGLRRVFVLTTQTIDWFEQMGFKESTLDTLPEKKQAAYNPQRRSRIFARELER